MSLVLRYTLVLSAPRMTGALHTFIFLLFYFISSQAFPQQLNFRSFSFEQGLNTYNIQKTIQDKYGFIWIATQDGLYRYNGTTFEALRKGINTIANLRENFVMDIFYRGGDTLYAATFNGGIDAIDVRTLSVMPILDNKLDSCGSLPNLWIKKVFCDQKGNLWIGGKDYLTIHDSKNKSCTHLTKIHGADGAVDISFITSIDENTVAVGLTDLGILLYDIHSLKLKKRITNLTGTSYKNCQVTGLLMTDHHTYLSTNLGIIKGIFTNNNWVFEEIILSDKLGGCVINSMTLGNDEIWIGSNCGIGRFHMSTGDFTLFNSQMNQSRWLVDNTVRHLMIDKQNNLWVSTSKVLQFVSLDPNPFTHYTGNNPGSSKMDHIYSLVSKSDHEIFATGTDGLYITHLETGHVEKVKGSQALGIIHYIMNLEKDLWLVSTDQGLYPYITNRGLLPQDYLQEMYPEWKPHVRNIFNTSVRINNKIYWASEEQEGLLVWDLDARSIKKYKAFEVSSKSLPENHIHNIKQDREGNLWLLFDNSVAKYNVSKDTVVQVIQYNEVNKSFNARIYFDAFDDGSYIWFGTFSGGLNGFNKKTGTWEYITEEEGLCNNAVYGILPEKDSIVWASTNMGISRVNYVTKKCTNYYFEDGLQDNSFDEKGALALGNRLFFGGINGFTMLDLSNYEVHPKPFPVYIHRVEYYTKGEKKVHNQLDWQKIVLPPYTSSIIIHLSALTFSNSKKIRFSYKIGEYGDDYIPVSEDNKIMLNAMSTGDYEIKIRYLNEVGDFVTDNLKLNIFVSPIWYQTWWFKVLIVLFVLLVTYAIYKNRLNQVVKEQKIRRSIASDLHDDIGGTLSSAKMLTHLAASSPSDKTRLAMIESNLEQASANLRDLLWVLDDRLDTIADLIDRLTKYGLNTANAANVTLDFSSDDASRNYLLSKAEKKNLYLIGKEAINNSLKYAGCHKISIRFSLVKKKLSMQIEDDGNGFVVSEVKDGYGLENMVERAKQIDFTASIQSAHGSGTRIFLNKNN